MRVYVFALKYADQLHFDCIADSVSYGTLGARTDNHIISCLGCTLLYGFYRVLSDVPGKPFVQRVVFSAKSLQLVDIQRSDMKMRVIHKVLDAVFGRGKLDTIGFRTCRVVDRTICQHLKYRTSGHCNGGLKRSHYLVGLLHCRSNGYLVSGRGIDNEPICLYAVIVH